MSAPKKYAQEMTFILSAAKLKKVLKAYVPGTTGLCLKLVVDQEKSVFITACPTIELNGKLQIKSGGSEEGIPTPPGGSKKIITTENGEETYIEEYDLDDDSNEDLRNALL